MFLSVTKCNDGKVNRIKNELFFEGSFSVPSDGRSGGLALLWSKDINLSINSFSMGHIDATIKEDLG